MKRWLVAAAVVALAVVLFASLTTARAYQASSEERAHVQLTAAKVVLDGLFASAQADGVPAAHLAALRTRERRILAARVPGGLPFWRPEVPLFYRHQAALLRRLNVRVAVIVRRDTAAARSTGLRALSQLRREIASADALDLDTGIEVGIASRDGIELSSQQTPKALLQTAAGLDAAMVNLQKREAPERAYVSTLLKQTGNSQDGIRKLVEREVAARGHHLDLMGLVTRRAATYRTQLARLEGAVTVQPTAFAAAVKESRLHAALDSFDADYARTVPDKMIVVSTEAQSATVYQGGKVILSTPVTTGGPELPTDHGVFHIYFKASPFTFHSPWPPSSPFYYPPTPIQYWMPFDGAEGLHDASWRSNFGPGSDLSPTDLGTGRTILGTHGCVNLPTSAATFIWNWAPVGTMVVVI